MIVVLPELFSPTNTVTPRGKLHRERIDPSKIADLQFKEPHLHDLRFWSGRSYRRPFASFEDARYAAVAREQVLHETGL